jgi:hypothetical protein
MRSALVPVVSFASNIVQWVLLGGIIMVQSFPQLLLFGIVLFAATTLFSFITLPVEINASSRALVWLSSAGITNVATHDKAEDALRSAAYTYVVAALGSLATLLYYIMIFSVISLASLMMLFSVPCFGNSRIKPTTLTCEYMQNPSVVDVQSPRLSWINEVTSTTVRGEKQQAYRIGVASSKENLLKNKFDIWDSGKVNSSDSYLVSYKGSKLLSTKDYWWKVMVWDSKGAASVWSEPAHWGMGLLSSNEWKAKWIGAPWQGEQARKIIEKGQSQPQTYPSYPAPLFRKAFAVNKEIKSAKAFVTGLVILNSISMERK